MPKDSGGFLKRCFLFDIEINENNEIYSLGAVLGGQQVLIEPGKKIGKRQLADVDALASGADFILGHNILAHDIPSLAQVAPELRLLRKPAIDTLYLSPLAYPENPYHRLVKDYQLVRDSVNNPAQDAKLAGRVFAEQWQAFVGQLAQGADAPLLYRGFFHLDPRLQGLSAALASMGVPLLEGDDLLATFSRFLQEKVCEKARKHWVDHIFDGQTAFSPLSYVTAWLSVAGGNSVLPPWVRHHFPEVVSMLHQLRECPCGSPKCNYCNRHHNPRIFLQDFFGFDDFRPTPATVDNKSLQEEIVKAAAANASLFATLPTGGGKSLCYLLPALMRYQRRNALTIVISPLQALMKDQVDNFSRQTGTGIAAALSGMLTLPERGVVLEGIRLGDIGILYVSPEQLRNKSFINTIRQREIGAWIFDEAHCLSKWGHDFRPDYLYSVRFIREFAQKEKSSIPPVQCFTATAKKDVKSEIIDMFRRELGLKIMQFEGGHERSNLIYEVRPVDPYDKKQTVLELLRVRYQPPGSVVIYCARRKGTEDLAEFLQVEGFVVEAFHAGLNPVEKKRIQDAFIAGDTPVICATNAFGMGIDKDDVRLVIHYDIPGSLENYLQEAGRAGRDRDEAECILIFTDQDIETQFTLSSMSRLTRREIAQFLRGLRYAAKGEEQVVLTTGELMRQEVVDLDPDEYQDADTRVRTAVSWLERGGYLERNENNTRVFQGTPLVRNLDEAREKIAKLDLPRRQQERWLAILAALMENGTPNRGFSADELAGLSAFSKTDNDLDNETEAQRVIRTLNDMAEQKLLNKETTLTAYVRYKVKNSSQKLLQRTCSLEGDFLKVLQEAAPDAETEIPLELDLRQVNQQLLDLGHDYSTPHSLNLILQGLSRDGKGIAGQRGSVTVKNRGYHRFTVFLHRDWNALTKTVKIRQQAATVALRAMLATVEASVPAAATLLVEFTLEAIVDALRKDLLLLAELKDPLAAAERALTFMNEQSIVNLQQGLAVFHQAMTISLNRDKKGKSYSQEDFTPLKTHYGERSFQIHVMNEYAKRALDTINMARGLVASYFHDEKEDFIKRFFPGRNKMLSRATSEQSYQRIVDDLQNPAQETIVAAETSENILVLAGPGSGKTRVVAHRIAFLLRVKRVRPSAILVLCFNRSAVMSLRRRVRDLVGNTMQGITTLTFHGLALRLTGRSLVGLTGKERSEAIDFSRLIEDAIRLLKGEADVLGFGDDPPRDALIGRFSHILVDEYQDIDEEQYELVSLLAGKTVKEREEKMTILAVGDDDQNIYRFRGANVDFIRRFHNDYEASTHYLVENYRSTANIIAAGNMLIGHNSDRMKTDHSIRINRARKNLPPGSNWQILDPLVQGKVQVFEVANQDDQALVLLEEIRRLHNLGSGFSFAGCAILAREWKELDRVRALFEQARIEVNVNWDKHSFPSLTRIRENCILLEYLQQNRTKELRASDVLSLLPQNMDNENIWQINLRGMINDWAEETGDNPQPVPTILDYFYETLTEQRRSGHLGKGIFLSTVHSVKGLEFDHVYILGGGWRQEHGAELEEERRLYYVAMSRARETLHLFSLKDHFNPHSAVLSGKVLLRRSPVPAQREVLPRFRYQMLIMKDFYIDYAARKSLTNPVHKALAELRVGDLLKADIRNGRVELVDNDGISVARLSRAAGNHWQPRLQSIREITVLAMIRRRQTDISDAKFSDSCRVESWDVPIVELKVDS